MKPMHSHVLRTFVGALALSTTLIAPTRADNSPAAADESRILRVVAATSGTPQRVWLPLNKAIVVELDKDARDVLVANPAIADAVVRTPRRIFLMALKVGQTNAIFMDAQGRQIATVEVVVGSDVSGLNEQLSRELPGSKVQAQALNDNIVLSGFVATAQEASRAQDLADRFAGQLPGQPNKIVNNIGIEQKQQVLIQVRVSEMSRAISKQLGLNVAGAVSIAGVPVLAQTDNSFNLLGHALSDLSGGQIGLVCPGAFTPSSSFRATTTTTTSTDPTVLSPVTTGSAVTQLASPCTSPNNVQGTIKALERIGLVHTLAEPNLTAVSGEAAKFLAGGEFPVPVGRDREGNIIIEYKSFGIGLGFTPVVLSKGRISLQVSTEVSELTNTNSLKLADVVLPGLNVRRAATTVELPSGGSIAIGGLIQQQTKQILDAFPGMKDLPVLGALFRSRDFQNNESELVVTVNAYLVNPVAPTEIARPDDGYVVPTDPETILLGRLNAVYGKSAPPDVPKNAVGYIVP